MNANGNLLERVTATGRRCVERARIEGKLQRSAWILGSAGVLVLVGTLGSGLEDAGAHSGPSKWDCNNRTIKGTYGGHMEGTRPIPGTTGTEAFVGVVIRTYDGAGNFTQVDTVKGASGIGLDRPGSGTYQVNADCSATTLFQPAPGVVIEEKMVIVDYGNETHSITIRPQAITVTAAAKRIGFR